MGCPHCHILRSGVVYSSIACLLGGVGAEKLGFALGDAVFVLDGLGFDDTSLVGGGLELGLEGSSGGLGGDGEGSVKLNG